MSTQQFTQSDFGARLAAELQAAPTSSKFSAEQLEVIYALAYAHVVQGQYAQALPMFSILVTYGPTRKHYLAGLALCQEKCGQLEHAIASYTLLLVLHPDSLQAAMQIAECYLQLGDSAQADVQLERVLRCIEETGQGQEFKARATLLRGLARAQGD